MTVIVMVGDNSFGGNLLGLKVRFHSIFVCECVLLVCPLRCLCVCVLCAVLCVSVFLLRLVCVRALRECCALSCVVVCVGSVDIANERPAGPPF